MKTTKYKSYDQLPLVLTATDIAAVLCISRSGAYALLKREDFPAISVGNRKIIPKQTFIKWLEQSKD